MIKKIDIDYDSPCRLRQEYGQKINELCDIINTIQKEREAEWFEIKEWIGILEAVRKSVNIHEKQIDELQMKVEPEKCETRPENVQPDTETRPENVQKIDIGELAYLQKENSDLKDEVEQLQKQLAEWQNANVSLIKDSAICNTYTYIRWDELCRLREIADKYAEITGYKGVYNE